MFFEVFNQLYELLNEVIRNRNGEVILLYLPGTIDFFNYPGPSAYPHPGIQ